MLTRTFALTLIVLALGPFAVMSAQAQQADYSGVYDTNGANPDGSRYAGVTDVSLNADGTYAVAQAIAGSVLQGTGYDQGKDGLRVVFDSSGLEATYVRQGDGRLQGVWGPIGGPLDGTETLVPR